MTVETLPALPLADVESIVLRAVGSTARVDVRDRVTSASLTRSTTEASGLILTVLDEDRSILRSGLLGSAIDVQVQGLWFRLAHVGKQGDQLTLTFEDRTVAALRLNRKPRKASRADLTRAQFAASMVAESKRYPAAFWSPELKKRQPLASETRQTRDATRQPGLDAGADLTIKGKTADRRQLRNIEAAMSAAEDLGATKRAILAMLVAGIGESEFRADARNPTSGASGVFQLLATTATAFGLDPRDTAACALQFLVDGFTAGKRGGVGAIPTANKNPTMSVGTIAARVEGSDANGRFYDRHRDEAEAILAAFGGGVKVTSTFTRRYEFSRGEPGGRKGENTWEALQRLAGEVGWVCFSVAGTVFFAAEEDLFRGRSMMTLTEQTPGVSVIDFDRETNNRLASQATVECLADVWAAPPGSVVTVKDCGPGDGRWLVTDITRQNLFDAATTITLSKPAEELPEPRSEQGQRATPSLTGTLRERVVAIARECAENSRRNPSYYFYSQLGRWKNDPLLPDRPGMRSDCSSFVISVYDKAGCDLPASMKGQGFTGTLAAAGQKTTSPKPGDIVLYGQGPNYRHVELFIEDGRTIGHGSAPIDYDTPRGISGFAGYWTFGFLDGDGGDDG